MAKEMIVTVPFSYIVKHIPKGKRNEVEFTVLDEAKVVLMDLTPEEAPAGLRFVPKEWRRNDEQPADHPWWGGKLWEPFSYSKSGESERAMTADELVTALGRTAEGNDDHGSPFYGVRPHKPWKGTFIAPNGLPPGRTMNDGGAERDEKLVNIASRAAELIVVGGKVHAVCPEPVYHVTHASGWGRDRRSDEPTLYLETIAEGKVSANQAPSMYWRVDRLDDAIADLAESENHRRTHYGHEAMTAAEAEKACVWNKVEVLIPECVRFRYDMKPRVDIAADQAFEGLKEGLAEADAGYFAVYAEFRALYRAVPRDHAAIVASLKGGVIEALRADREHLARRMEETVEEWVNRDDPSSITDADLAGLGHAA
jgi:hypothetical protein